MASKVRVNKRFLAHPEFLLTLQPSELDAMAFAIDDGFRANERKLFQTEGSSGGGRWAPLSPAYAYRKDLLFGKARRTAAKRAREVAQLPEIYRKGAQKGTGLAQNKILQLTGTMKRSLTERGPEHVAEWRQTAGRTIVTVGTRNEVAAYHLEIDTHRPIRDPIKMTKDQRQGLVEIMASQMVNFLRRRVRVLAAEGAR